MKKVLALSFCALLALASLGCGQKTPDGMPDLQPTTLTVIQGGSPLADATVNLKSLDPSTAWTCGGVTDAKGVATLVTHGQYKGAPVGKYKVSVSKTVGEGTPPPPSPIDEESARKYKEYQDSGATYEEFDVVDTKFSIIETTPLEVEVVKGKNDLAVDVGEAVRIPVRQSSGVAPVAM
ncbi:MAG: carboxypeptidase regulatory-like domain-containing protein [Thermoguttaceae bacterium]|nr:carboxypeptidase regulatory-like domain-containing protein [Thermoguttaceae bacterium]